MSSSDKPKKRSNSDFWRACGFLLPYRKLVIISFVSAFVAGIIMTSGIPAMVPILRVIIYEETLQAWMARIVAERQPDVPFYLEYLSRVVNLLPEGKVQVVAVIFVGIAILGLMGNIVRFIYEYYSNSAAIGAVNDVRRAMYDHMLHMPLGFFGLKGTSDVTSRLVNDAATLQEGFKIVLGQSMLEIFRGSLALGAAMLIDWRLTLFIVVFLLPTGWVIQKFGRKMRRASRAALQNSSSMLGQVEASLSGIRVVKAANAERFERRRFTGILQMLRRQQLKMAHYDALSTPVLETLGMWSVGAVLIFATYLMFSPNVQDKLNPTWFMAQMVALVTIGESLRKLSKVNNVIQRSGAAATRIFEMLDAPIERSRAGAIRRSPDAAIGELINLPPVEREVRFESVTFTYPGASTPAITDVELVVPKGKSVAIVGRNGSGKTTLMALLPRFYDPELGRVTIDRVDIRKATLRSLRRQISVVTQDSVIFPGTVAENIAYGHPLAPRLGEKDSPIITQFRARIEEAARRAFAHDFIVEKPLGYDAPLDGLGGQLSGGQKQRLNIARAILREAPILILDEATSQVDSESEHLIQQAIERLMHERTTFVIAHRLNTIISADSIVVMDRGRIIDQGKHEALLNRCETYQQLYERQMFAAPV